VQHREVVVCVREALTSERIEPATFETTLTLTANGERMALSVLMPEEDRFDYSIAPNDAMRFRLECFNSVDGTMRLMLAMGWLRFVCSNGLVLGRSVAHVRRAHTPTLNLRYVGRAIREGLINAAKDRTRWDAWRSTRVEPEALRRWADGSLRQQWGVKAAARTFAICTTGSDVELIKPFESNLPSQRSSTPLGKVPGAPPAATNVFDVAQALSWVAGQRRDLDASAAAIRDIPTVVDMLVRRLHERRN
jgi:hypothetical protein